MVTYRRTSAVAPECRHPSQSGAMGFVVVGRAVTQGQTLPLGADDPVVAARAVRRAIAAAHGRAADVGELVIAAAEPIGEDVARAFARRALGPRGDAVPVGCVRADEADHDAEALAQAALRAAMPLVPGGADTDGAVSAPGLVIAVGLGADGTTVAFCAVAGAGPSPAR